MAKKRRHKGPRRHRVEIAPRAGGGRALEVDGVVQSVVLTPGPSPTGRGETEAGEAGQTGETGHAPTSAAGEVSMGGGGYWELLLPGGCPKRALIVGLGGGTVAALLARRCPGVAMVGIERDETVLALARSDFGLDEIAGLQVVVADAFAEIPARAEREPSSYDFICLDLYEGGRLVPGTLATAFLRHLAALLAPSGTLSVNLIISGRLGEQLHRIGRAFVVEREWRTRGNVVVHARLPDTLPDTMPRS